MVQPQGARRSHRRAPRGVRWFAVALAVGLWIAGGAAIARFTDAASIDANTLATATLQPPADLALTAVAPPALGWTASPSTWSTGTRVYRSTSAVGPRTLVGSVTPRTTTTFSESPGLGAYYYEARSFFENWESVASNQVVRDAPTFVFGGSNDFTGGGNCVITSQVEHDMLQGYTPTGTALTWSRTGGTGTVNFCSDGLRAGETLAAGTTTINAYVVNTHGSTCQLTTTLSLNGTSTLGSGSFTVPDKSPLSLRTWSFPTTGFTAAAGDRLELHVVWQGVKACEQTDLHWNGATTPSSVTVPTITGA